jgi:hypothetical protein
MQAFMQPELFVHPIGRERYRTAIIRSCPGVGFGQLIFENRPISRYWGASVPWENVEQFKKEVMASSSTAIAQIDSVPLMLVICVSYKVVGDDHFHYTRRVFDVGGERPGSWKIGKDLGEGDVHLEESYEDDDAN